MSRQQGKYTNGDTQMSKSVTAIRGCVLAVVGVVLSGLPALAQAGFTDTINMPKGVTPISHHAYNLHMLILSICAVIGLVVFGAMFYSIVRHRKSVGHEAAQFHHSTKAEILWTIIPVFILVGMAIPATRAVIDIEDASDADVTIKVTGYQWKWRYQYQGTNLDFYSNLAQSSRDAINRGTNPAEVQHYLLDVDKPMVIPVNKKVRLLLTADDVIHAWWVPAFGMKRDAIPGFVNEMWIKASETGVYRGQCAELCGAFHGFMPIVVKVKSDADYKSWLAKQTAAPGG